MNLMYFLSLWCIEQNIDQMWKLPHFVFVSWGMEITGRNVLVMFKIQLWKYLDRLNQASFDHVRVRPNPFLTDPV